MRTTALLARSPLAGLLVAGAVLGLTACNARGGTSTDPGPPTSVSPSPTDVPATPTPAPADEPSQDAAAAPRDGVVPELAALAFDVRVDPIQSVTAPEGTWVVSRPTSAADEAADGCQLGTSNGRYPDEFICTWEYGEVLLLDASGSSILRAYPLPSVPAEVLVVGDDAVYCGRAGAMPMTDGMACRIDRTTLEATVRVFPDSESSTTLQPCFFAPDNWTFHDTYLGVTELRVDQEGPSVRTPDGAWVQLDPITLEPRDAPAPAGHS